MMHDLLFVGMFVLMTKSLYVWRRVALDVIAFILLSGIGLGLANIAVTLWRGVITRLPEWQRILRKHQLKLKAYLVTILGGYDPLKVNWLMSRAALLSLQASSGKYTNEDRPLVKGQIKFVQDAIVALDGTYAERFRCQPRLRILETDRKRRDLSRFDQIDAEVRDGDLLEPLA